jgi:hypothetical protein
VAGLGGKLRLLRNHEKVRSLCPEAFFQMCGISGASASLNEIRR